MQIHDELLLEVHQDEIDYIFGDIYTVYGRGLSLYSFNDRDIDYDNSVRGLSMFYSKSVDNGETFSEATQINHINNNVIS